MSDGRRRPARTPAKGKPWPKMVRDAALELLRKGATLPEAMAGLEERFDFRPSPPARSALAKWAKVAGVTVNVTPANRRDTSRALEARLERMAAERDALSELLLGELARPAAEALARRLSRSATDEDLLVMARDKWADALRLEAMAADFNPEEVKAAKRATRQAMLEVRIAEVNLIGARELVGVLTRSVSDHLALEGLAALMAGEDDDRAGLTVVLEMPTTTDPVAARAKAVPEHELGVSP